MTPDVGKPIPSDILHDECNKDTKHCVLVGRVEQIIVENAVEHYPAGVLWLVDSEYSSGIYYNGLLKVPVESVSEEDFISVVTGFIFRISGSLPGLKVSCSIEYLHSDRYASLGRQMKGLFLSAASFMPTQRARKVPASFYRQKCMLKNLPRLEQALLPQSARGMLEGMPAVILGAGPSLDVSLPKLAALQDRCLIFATDSTLGACSKYGIKPDFIVNIDPDKPAAMAWPSALDGGLVLLTLQSTEDWFEREGAHFWVIPMGSLTEHWLENQRFPIGERIAASNAGFTGLVMADALGCGPLLLLGMDMSIDSGDSTQTHSSHVTEVDNIEDVIRTRESIPVKQIPGNYEDTVPTIFYPFYKELNLWLEREGKQVVNVNDRGAAFVNSKVVHPDQMSEWFDQYIPSKPLPKEDLYQELKSIKSEVAEGASELFLPKVVSAARRGLHLLQPLVGSVRDPAWETAALQTLRLVIQDEDIQGILGGFFMDRLASLAASELPEKGMLEGLFEQTHALLHTASEL